MTGAFLGTPLVARGGGRRARRGAAPASPRPVARDRGAAARPARRRWRARGGPHAPVRAPGGARDRGEARGGRRRRGRLRRGRGGGQGDHLGGGRPRALSPAGGLTARRERRGRAPGAHPHHRADRRRSLCRWCSCTRSPASRSCGSVFGDDLAEASGALPLLGLAMALLACTYLSVQYLLGLHRARFIGCSPPRRWPRWCCSRRSARTSSAWRWRCSRFSSCARPSWSPSHSAPGRASRRTW